MYHHLTTKLLYLAKRVRPDLQPAVSFLCTRVQSPDKDDWKKLGRCLTFLRDTKHEPLTLSADGSWTIRWWVDASYAVHPDMKSHTGATMSLGQGCVYSMSTKQKLNTRSSTESKLVGVWSYGQDYSWRNKATLLKRISYFRITRVLSYWRPMVLGVLENTQGL